MARHIKTGDMVKVIAGTDKGKTGKVLKIISDKDRVIVEGINTVWKHVRPSQRYPQGGRIKKDAAIHISNVLPVEPTSGQATRVDLWKNRMASTVLRLKTALILVASVNSNQTRRDAADLKQCSRQTSDC